jgi:DNA-binding XRE family transcriptional regulator
VKNNIVQIRMGLNMSMVTLARKAGISHSSVYDIECENRVPTLPTAIAICKALGRSMKEVFPDCP